MFSVLRISLLLIPVLLSGCALNHQNTRDEQAGKVLNKIENKISIKPAGSYEECIALKSGQVLVYNFSSVKPVDFNIHYHVEDAIKYPVRESEVLDHDGVFDLEKERINPDNEEFFCLMWENHDYSQSNISYKCMVKEK